ncbi:MAG: hypothetical protein GTN49_06480 [candidate division Zixibacteria bacterium]|nr:hypothetical protein [candidate division Zixibacteria bacterium]
MDLYDLLMKRRSVRNFDAREIPAEIVAKLVAAANNAPTGGNLQPLTIVVVREVERRAKLGEMVGGQPWVKNAPLSMIFCLDFFRLKRWAEASGTAFRGEEALSHFLIAYADVMCAAQTVVILAENYGLGSVYIGTILFAVDQAREYFAIPRFVLPVMVLSLGYPKTVPKNIPKLAAEIVVHLEKYETLSDEAILDAFEDKYGEIDENVERYFERAFVEAVEAERQEREERLEAIKEGMKRLQIKNNAEFLFRLRYPADFMVELNANMVDSFKNAGFECFGS